mgnify:CR=1 FL=1
MSLQRYPGFIDVHVHLRDPGATHKEDFRSGTRAAIKGGFTFVLDMPNNPLPTISIDKLEEKIKLAYEKSICDIGFHYGTNGLNTDSFKSVWGSPRVYGLKIYCNHTTGEMLIEDEKLLNQVFKNWESTKPILVHAEGPQLEMAISMAKTYGRRLHVCHISQAVEVKMVRDAKAGGQAISAGVCPHHLFMTDKDREVKRGYAMMKPPLGTQADQNELWSGLNDGAIDLVETDHAPHTKEEKEKDQPAFGVPGLETAVGLLGKAIYEKIIPELLLKTVLYDNPKKIFNIPDQANTYVEIDLEKHYILKGPYETKCGWSPFEGWELVGRVENVRFKGRDAVKNNKLLI